MNEKKFSEEDLKEMKEQILKESKRDALNNIMFKLAQQATGSIANNEIVSQKKNIFNISFDTSTVSNYISNPQKYEKELRQLSTILTTMSPQYQSIMGYLPSICRFIPVAYPNVNKFSTAKGTYDVEKLKKEYGKAVAYLSNMNIQHEFMRVMSVCTREDVFYGYEYETNDSYYIQQLDSDFCKITNIEDGVFNFSFDFTYFDKYKKIKGIEVELVEIYPPEFQEKYKVYLNDKNNMRWQQMDSSKTICIKFLEDVPYVFPPFANLFDDIADLSDYKALNKGKNEIENYKLIGLQIPTLSKTGKADDFAVDPDTALAFYEMIISSLPKGIGAFLSVTDIKQLDFNSSKASDTNEVAKAEDAIFSGSGISPVNFGKGADNAGTIKVSNSVDQARVFKVYDQLERWLNRKFKFIFKGKFSVSLLKVSEFNIKEERENALKQAQFGVPNKIILSALNGVSQQMERGLSVLENEVLGLHDSWVPLQSSHTQSASDGGAPKKDEEDLSPTGVSTRDNAGNEK